MKLTCYKCNETMNACQCDIRLSTLQREQLEINLVTARQHIAKLVLLLKLDKVPYTEMVEAQDWLDRTKA